MEQQLEQIRKLLNEASKFGVVEDRDFLDSMLTQVLIDTENKRIRCLRLAEDFKRQTLQAEAQAATYSQVSSIIHAVLSGFIQATQNKIIEESDLKKDQEVGLDLKKIIEKDTIELIEKNKSEKPVKEKRIKKPSK